MVIVNAYVELGSYRAAANLCGVNHKTVKRVVKRWRAGTVAQPRPAPPSGRNTDCVENLIWNKVRTTRARTSAAR
jgi:transposase